MLTLIEWPRGQEAEENQNEKQNEREEDYSTLVLILALINLRGFKASFFG
jgi:hypothetical protein